METNHNRKVIRGEQGLVFERGERWIWSAGKESHQTRIGGYKRQVSLFTWK